MNINVPIKNISTNPLPAYATIGSAGLDLRAWLTESLLLAPFERVLVPTGLFVEIPVGYEAQIRPRSGLAIKHGITCLNSPGTIDSDYRGEIKVILINLGQQPHTLEPGDRIAQIVFQSVCRVNWTETASLESSERGEGGFGHSGQS